MFSTIHTYLVRGMARVLAAATLHFGEVLMVLVLLTLAAIVVL